MLAVGKHEATVTNYGQGTNSNGKDFVWLTLTSNGEQAGFQGYLSELAIERTMDQLVTAGCRDLGGIAEGPTSNAFTPDHKCMITVEHETYEGKPRARVRFINPLNQARDASTIAKGKETLSKYAAQFELARQKKGATQPQAAVAVGF